MKKLIICLFLASLFITDQANAITKQNAKYASTVSVQKNETVTIKITDKKEVVAIIASLKEEKAKENASFQVCFVHITDVYFREAMDGTLYLTIEYNVQCYGVPGVNDMVFVIDQTQ